MKINPYEAHEKSDMIARLQAQAKDKHISKDKIAKRSIPTTCVLIHHRRERKAVTFFANFAPSAVKFFYYMHHRTPVMEA